MTLYRLIVFILLMMLLITASGAALHMGIFKVHRQDTGFIKKALCGIVSYGFSALVWLLMYSHYYLKW